MTYTKYVIFDKISNKYVLLTDTSSYFRLVELNTILFGCTQIGGYFVSVSHAKHEMENCNSIIRRRKLNVDLEVHEISISINEHSLSL